MHMLPLKEIVKIFPLYISSVGNPIKADPYKHMVLLNRLIIILFYFF